MMRTYRVTEELGKGRVTFVVMVETEEVDEVVCACSVAGSAYLIRKLLQDFSDGQTRVPVERQVYDDAQRA